MTATLTALPSSIYLSEDLISLHAGQNILASLRPGDREQVLAAASRSRMAKGESLFLQGSKHTGLWVIESGRVRTFYAGPSGKEITLAYWTEGQYVGGPDVFGGGQHVWSATIVDEARLLFLPGTALRRLVRVIPDLAVAVIEAQVAKGRAYSSLIQMLGTRSVSERLQQLLLILVNHQSEVVPEGVRVARTMSNEQIAMIVGATRQWVSQSFDNLQKKGVLTSTRQHIVIHHPECLSE